MAKARKRKKARRTTKKRGGRTAQRAKFAKAAHSCTAKVRGQGFAFGEKAGWKAYGKCMKSAL
jgi:hypothetical protein